jgi:hypothetical protein
MTGKLKNIIKLIITLIFKKNFKKYNLIVIFRFNIAIFEDVHIAANTHLFLKTISYFAYAVNIFIIVDKKNITRKI